MPSNISKQNPQPTSPLDILRHETLQDRRSLFLHRHHRPLAFTARLLLGNDPDDLAFVLSITQIFSHQQGPVLDFQIDIACFSSFSLGSFLRLLARPEETTTSEKRTGNNLNH